VIHRLARLVVVLSAWLVPRTLRPRWREEWLGELDSSRRSLGGGGRTSKFYLLRRVAGAPVDAAAARVTSVGHTLRALAAGWRTDLFQTTRSLLHSPKHVVAVVASLAIGLTVSISVFSAVNALLYGEIPGIESRRTLARLFISHDQVFGVEGFGRAGTVAASPLAISDFEVLEADDGPALEGVAAEGDRSFPVALGEVAAGTRGAFVSADYFRILGTQPVMGRFLAPSDHRAGAPPVAVIGFHLWRDRLGAPANIVGQSLLIGGQDFGIVGVAPPRFTGVQPSDVGASPLDYTQVWLPLRFAATWSGGPSRDHPWLTVVGRLAPGFTIETARPTLGVAAARLVVLQPDARKNAAFLLRSHGFGPNDSPLDVLLIIALFLAVPLSVLAIACANVASLQLARATERTRELAVRLALGASRGQLLRLLTLDAVLLAGVATTAGWLGASGVLAAVREWFPLALHPDGRVVIFALTLGALVVVLTGLAPAWLVLRRSTASGLKQAAQSGGLAHARLRHALVVVQIAVSLILLAMSALFVRSVQARRADVPALLREQLLGGFDFDALGYTPAQSRQFLDDLQTRLQRDPRIQGVGISFERSLRYRRAASEWPFARGLHVNTSWFDTNDARLLAGRLFDGSGGSGEAVISARLARDLGGDASAIGRLLEIRSSTDTVLNDPNRIRIPRDDRTVALPPHRVTVVGVVADARRRPENTAPDAVIYQPLADVTPGQVQMRLRTASRAALVADVRQAVRDIEPRLPWIDLQNGETAYLREVGVIGYMALSVGGLGTIGLVLAAGGLYAVMAYVVSARRRELGIRLALGAGPGDIVALVFRQAIKLALVGVFVGVAAALPLALALRSALVGISPVDPVGWGPPIVVLFLVACAAGGWPASQAARIDPVRALREE
jgi:predicted permease